MEVQNMVKSLRGILGEKVFPRQSSQGDCNMLEEWATCLIGNLFGKPSKCMLIWLNFIPKIIDNLLVTPFQKTKKTKQWHIKTWIHECSFSPMGSCEGIFSRWRLGSLQVTALPTQSLVVFRGRVLCVATEQNSEYNTTSEARKGWNIRWQVMKLQTVEVFLFRLRKYKMCHCGTRSLSLQVYTINIVEPVLPRVDWKRAATPWSKPWSEQLGKSWIYWIWSGCWSPFLLIFTPYRGNDPIWLQFFKWVGWNHQLVMTWLPFQVMKCLHPYRSSGDPVRILASTWRGSIHENSYFAYHLPLPMQLFWKKTWLLW